MDVSKHREDDELNSKSLQYQFKIICSIFKKNEFGKKIKLILKIQINTKNTSKLTKIIFCRTFKKYFPVASCFSIIAFPSGTRPSDPRKDRSI